MLEEATAESFHLSRSQKNTSSEKKKKRDFSSEHELVTIYM